MITVPRQTPNPPTQAPPGLDAPAGRVIGWLKRGVPLAGMVGLLVGVLGSVGAR